MDLKLIKKKKTIKKITKTKGTKVTSSTSLANGDLRTAVQKACYSIKVAWLLSPYVNNVPIMQMRRVKSHKLNENTRTRLKAFLI